MFLRALLHGSQTSAITPLKIVGESCHLANNPIWILRYSTVQYWEWNRVARLIFTWNYDIAKDQLPIIV